MLSIPHPNFRFRLMYRANSRHERSPDDRTKKNVDHLCAELPALMLMRDRTHPPRYSDTTVLEGGARIGRFWNKCKRDKRCTRPPYDELLTNRVLRADYRCSFRGTREA